MRALDSEVPLENPSTVVDVIDQSLWMMKIAAGLLATTQSVIQYIRGYEEAGCGELVLLPTIAEPSQLDRLAEVCASL